MMYETEEEHSEWNGGDTSDMPNYFKPPPPRSQVEDW